MFEVVCRWRRGGPIGTKTPSRSIRCSSLELQQRDVIDDAREVDRSLETGVPATEFSMARVSRT
jgi:hypothetical protein